MTMPRLPLKSCTPASNDVEKCRLWMLTYTFGFGGGLGNHCIERNELSESLRACLSMTLRLCVKRFKNRFTHTCRQNNAWLIGDRRPSQLDGATLWPLIFFVCLRGLFQLSGSKPHHLLELLSVHSASYRSIPISLSTLRVGGTRAW